MKEQFSRRVAEIANSYSHHLKFKIQHSKLLFCLCALERWGREGKDERRTSNVQHRTSNEMKEQFSRRVAEIANSYSHHLKFKIQHSKLLFCLCALERWGREGKDERRTSNVQHRTSNEMKEQFSRRVAEIADSYSHHLNSKFNIQNYFSVSVRSRDGGPG